MSRYPHLRHAQANPGPFGSHRPAPRRRLPFGAVVTGGFVAVFAATWFATPTLAGLWTAATPPPGEAEAIERSIQYSGCDQARAAGAAPIRRGSPGYREEMDGDGDGIACEAYGGSGGRGSMGSHFRRLGRRYR
jgi:hypothetical protein